MKKTQLLTKAMSIALVIVVLVGCIASFVACDLHKTKSVADIFYQGKSAEELTSAKLEFTLPAGWSVYTSSVKSSDPRNSASNINSDVGYIKEIDAFVVADANGYLSIVKCGDDRVYFADGMPGMILPGYIGVCAIRVQYGLIVCKFANGEAGVFDINGNTVLSRTKVGKDAKAIPENIKVDTAIKAVGKDMIAVNHSYDVNGVDGYTSIYRTTTSGDISNRGELVCRVSNSDNKLDYVLGFDDKYVTVVGNSVGDCVYSIPKIGESVKNLNGSTNGSLVNTGKDNYYDEITYIGNGKFYMHEEWTVTSSDDYTYFNGENYYVVSRYIYDARKDKKVAYTKNADKIFTRISNNYYDNAEKSGINTKGYLNDGYSYVSYGITIVGKIGFYDQFILDKNLKVVMSLTSNFGITLDGQEREDVNYFDLIVQSVDGYFYNAFMPSEVNIYDANGNRVGHNDRHIERMELANNMLIASIQDPNDSSAYLYGAFNLRGEEVIPFEYYSLLSFRGAYSIGQKLNSERVKTMYIVGSDGKEIEEMSDGSKPLYDIATSDSGTAIYKIGCYMFKVDSGERDSNGKTIYYYGVKNLNPNVDKNIIMPATMRAGCVLYAPTNSPKDVFVFEKITSGDSVTYAVYRLV